MRNLSSHQLSAVIKKLKKFGVATKAGKKQSEAQMRAKLDGRNAASFLGLLNYATTKDTPPELVFNADISGASYGIDKRHKQ